MNDPDQPTSDPTAHGIVVTIRDAIVDATGPSLVGLYVYGSFATGDFEPDVSDIDLIAVLADVPHERLVARLGEMHAHLAGQNPRWNDRIEVDYISRQGLASCRTHATTIARISPGESLHLLEAGREFLLDWYPAREDGITLLGPPIDALIPEIPEADYLREVRTYLAGFADRFIEEAPPGSQTYAILTMCRGVAALRFGERLSKREAAARIHREFPWWSDLIERALRWRDRQWCIDQSDGAGTVAETRSFLSDMARLLDLPAPGTHAE